MDENEVKNKVKKDGSDENVANSKSDSNKSLIDAMKSPVRVPDGDVMKAPELFEMVLVDADYKPKYGSELASGMDLKARIKGLRVQHVEDPDTKVVPGNAIYGSVEVRIKNDMVVIPPRNRALIWTGIKSRFPEGYEAQLRPRSGLAYSKGISIVNSPGTIDADYRDEWGVIIINHGLNPITIKDGDRICQMIIARSVKLEVKIVDNIDDEADRGGGFGSSGNK